MHLHKTTAVVALALTFTLSGCALDNLAADSDAAASSGQSGVVLLPNVPVDQDGNPYGRGILPTPVRGASVFPVGSGMEALEGGLWLLGDKSLSRIQVSGNTISHSRVATRNGAVFLSGQHLDYRIVNGQMVPLTIPASIKPVDPQTVELAFPLGMRVRVSLQALDVSGVRISSVLRDRVNQPHPLARKAQDDFFPKGSIAYLPVYRFLNDEIMVSADADKVPSRTIPDMLKSFSGDAPLCVRGEHRGGNELLGLTIATSPSLSKLLASKAIPVKAPKAKAAPKRAAKGKKAAPKGKARTATSGFKLDPKPMPMWPKLSGPMSIHVVDPTHVLCFKQKDAKPIPATWRTAYVNGTNIVQVDFDARKVNPRDMGVTLAMQPSASYVYAEIVKKGVHNARLYHSGKPLYDYRYRFNRTAAEAVAKATGAPLAK